MTTPLTLSVSVLNVVLNLFVIFLVALGAEIAQYSIYKSTQLQLKRRGTAPFLTESDDIFSHFKNRLWGARKSRNPFNLVFVMVAASLVVGEICSELGVDVSHRCSPDRFKTMGICAQSSNERIPDSRIVTNNYQTRLAGWDNQELQSHPIFEGLRKNFTGLESFAHYPTNRSQPVIVAGCSSSSPVRIEPYDATLNITRSMNFWIKNLSQGAIANGTKLLRGYGDLARNGKTMSVFLVAPSLDESSSHARVRMPEYHSKNHIQRLFEQFRRKNDTKQRPSGNLILRNEEFMVTYNIQCTRFSQSSDMFARGVQMFRSIQLEDAEYNFRNVVISGKVEETRPPMSASDAVRAAIALALTNLDNCPGETFVYTECGVYHWKFLIPLVLLFGFVVIYAIYNSVMVMIRKANIEIPHSSSSWSAVALQLKLWQEEKNRKDSDVVVDLSQTKQMRYQGIYQLVEGKDGRKEVRLHFDKPSEAEEKGQEERIIPTPSEDKP